MKKKTVAIVLAAGKGSRMKSKIQKQYMELKGYPVLYYSLKAFEDSVVDDVVLVTGEDEISYCKEEIVKRYHLTKVKKIIAGGTERYLSVLNAILAIKEDNYQRVLIHDGARPLISQEIINRCIEGIDEYKACVAAMPVKDTIKVANEENIAIHTPERKTLWAVQTPQAFDAQLIIEAYLLLKESIEAEKKILVTDDAMVVETFLKKYVKLIEGSYDNIKITTPEDLSFASSLL